MATRCRRPHDPLIDCINAALAGPPRQQGWATKATGLGHQGNRLQNSTKHIQSSSSGMGSLTGLVRLLQEGVPLLDPATRTFADLPAWVDASLEALRGKRVLMYCTGGVRCERASAYLRSRGPDFQDVFQLHGRCLTAPEQLERQRCRLLPSRAQHTGR